MPSTDFFGSLEEHTRVKLLLYNKYLECYLSILTTIRYIHSIHIYDLFCGKGETDDGQRGSALIALNQVISICTDYPSSKQYYIHFSDKEQEYCDELQRRINLISLPANINYDITCTKFEDALIELAKQQEIISNINTIKTLFFIDPFGYSNAQPVDLLLLKANPNAEIMIFLPATSMYRFVNTIPVNTSLEKWKDFIGDSSSCSDVYQFVYSINERFISLGYYSGYFILQNQSCGNKYALLFISSNLLGLHKFNEVKWKLDPHEGFRMDSDFSNLVVPSVSEDLLAKTLYKMKTDLIKHIDSLPSKTISNNSLYEYLLLNRFLPKHFNGIFKTDKFLKIAYTEGSIKGTYLVERPIINVL
ncbi:MAG: three-Cys-motif partner protein TcmP [Candidatus Cloacimonadaceae bacterium]|nr:three-Cys-motif partner protein TcmP [Candidatus Cloacimonadaceae bacterium]